MVTRGVICVAGNGKLYLNYSRKGNWMAERDQEEDVLPVRFASSAVSHYPCPDHSWTNYGQFESELDLSFGSPI